MKQIVYVLALLLTCLPVALAQGDGKNVSVELEAYVVSVVSKDDGTKEEQFTKAEAARPGQVVEYRVLVSNQTDETLPAETVLVTGPVPETTFYLADTASPSSEAVRTEFSVDGGESYSEPPIVITVKDENGDDKEVIAEPASYNAVRWTLLEALEPGAELVFIYRVEVR